MLTFSLHDPTNVSINNITAGMIVCLIGVGKAIRNGGQVAVQVDAWLFGLVYYKWARSYSVGKLPIGVIYINSVLIDFLRIPLLDLMKGM